MSEERRYSTCSIRAIQEEINTKSRIRRDRDVQQNLRPARLRPRDRALVDAALLQPWFLNRGAANAIMRLIPQTCLSRMRWYFEDYGCISCKKKKVEYHGNGLCMNCHATVRRRLRHCMKRRAKTFPETPKSSAEHWYLNCLEIAERLLKPFARTAEKKRRVLAPLHPQKVARARYE
jgi:hypothetical protein